MSYEWMCEVGRKKTEENELRNNILGQHVERNVERVSITSQQNQREGTKLSSMLKKLADTEFVFIRTIHNSNAFYVEFYILMYACVGIN